MSAGPNEPQLKSAAPITLTTVPEALSFAAHELRNPLSTAMGYLRLVLKDRTGVLEDRHRGLLENVEKSCGRFKEVLDEMSELASLEKDEVKLNRGAVDVLRLLKEASTELPPIPDRDVTIDVAGVSVRVHGDAVRLKAACMSILFALRRELVVSDRIAVRVHGDSQGSVIISIGEADHIDRLLNVSLDDLTPFKENRGGNGLQLAIARRVIESHGGRLSGLRDDLKAAIIAIPSLDT